MTDKPSVTLFGPGVGESICVGFGNGEWMIVDSCLNPVTRRPAALEFLEEKGVDPSRAVVLVVVSHWHDDHIRGISEVLQACNRAKLAIPAAMTDTEFTELTSAYAHQAPPSDNTSSGVSEMYEALRIAKVRMKLAKSGAIPAPLCTTLENMQIHVTTGVKVVSLSPSSAANIEAITEFKSQFEKGKRRGRVVPRPTSNLCATALHVQFQNTSVLLGSDLETSPNRLIGWSAVIQSPNRPTGKASLVKIPHHGSETGHHQSFWTELATTSPLGILTTYSRGVSKLPKSTDIARLKDYVDAVFCTTDPQSLKPARKDTVVEKMIKSSVKNRKLAYNPQLGRITATLNAQDEWEVECNEQASAL